jgi:hypothetical protein
MNPRETVMRGSGSDDGHDAVMSAARVETAETFEKYRQRFGLRPDVEADSNLPVPHPAADNFQHLAGLFVLHPAQLARKTVIEDPMDPGQGISTRHIQVRFVPKTLLDLTLTIDMGEAFHL